MINDPAVAYGLSSYRAQADDFQSASSVTDTNSDFEMIELVRKGLDRSTIYRLIDLLGITLDQMCDLIHISSRTLQRKADGESLGSLVSERALDLSRVLVQGVEALGSMQAFQSWLQSPRPALGGATPLSFLDTRLGCELIINILGRIEHGVYS
jgi:putative toxin-antitoxin system antitoxin component (TIGR02293 family)